MLAMKNLSIYILQYYMLLCQGELLSSVQPVYAASSQALCLAWHPVRKTLVVGWETGQLKLWNGERDFLSMVSPHSTPILVLKWSRMGGRLISIDAVRRL